MAKKQQNALKGKTGKEILEKIDNLLDLTQDQEIEIKKKLNCSEINDNLYAIRDVADRLNMALIITHSGALNSNRDHVAFTDVVRDLLESEIKNLTEIINDLNEHFPDQAIELEN